jgi:peroxiredoxin
VCTGLLGLACWLVLRQNGRLLLALEAQSPTGAGTGTLHPDDLAPLEPGALAPEFAGRDLDGEPVSLRSLLARGRPVVLFFTDPGCVACLPGLEFVAATQHYRADELTVAVISHGSPERMAGRAAQFGLRRVIPQSDDSLLEAYRVFAVPAVVLLDRDGRLVQPVALGAEAARQIIDGVEAEKPEVAVA